MLKHPSQQVLFIQIKYPIHMQTSSNHLSMGGLFMLTFLFLMVAQIHALRFHASTAQNPKEYDKDRYYAELTGLQQRLDRDVKAIQQKFTAINLRLSNTNISDSEKLIFLQENLANERDSLFNLQTYLNVPFALRSCQCLNVTQQQKKDLQAQIQDVQVSINGLQASLDADSKGNPYENPKCQNGKCAEVQAINSQIAQMRSYIKIMSDTATSECCKVINYVYRDNLQNAAGWVYGNTNEQEYRLSIFNKSQQANLTQCPADKPVANLTTNQCVACPSNTPLFNLGSRKCEASCTDRSLIFIAADHQCDYNRTCDEDKYFNNATHKCQINLGTDSSCPKDKPVWNFKTLSCNKCANSTPFFDTNIQACRLCTQNQIWQEYTDECLDKSLIAVQCTTGQYYDKNTKSCQTIPTTQPNGGTRVGGGTRPTNPGTNPSTTPGGQSPNSGTYSQCPPATPFWSTSDLACYKCPESTPSYNFNTNNCEKCPQNTTWSTTNRRCEKQPLQCPSGQVYDPKTQKCETKVNCEANQVYNSATGNCDTYSPTGQIGMCPPESPFWNAKTLYCQKCDEETPFWNGTAKECQKCSNNTVWDINKHICKSTLKQCSPGQILNQSTNNCEAIKCPSDSPIFNYGTAKCQPCPEGTKFNNATSICESIFPQRTNTSVCPSDAPYWNAQKLFCDVCPSGQAPDASKKCQPTASHFAGLPSHGQKQELHLVHRPERHQKLQHEHHLLRIGSEDHLQE